MATRSKRRYISAGVEDAIKAQLKLGRTPKQAFEELHGEFPEGDFPTLRTVQRIANEMPADTDVWAISDLGDGPAVIAALREVAVASNGGRLFLTKAEAAAVSKIALIAPDIPPLAHFLLAIRENEQEVQVFLAFAPWRGERERSMYLRMALRAGLRVPLVPPKPTLVLPGEPVDFWDAVARTLYEAEAFKGTWGKESSNG